MNCIIKTGKIKFIFLKLFTVFILSISLLIFDHILSGLSDSLEKIALQYRSPGLLLFLCKCLRLW